MQYVNRAQNSVLSNDELRDIRARKAAPVRPQGAARNTGLGQFPLDYDAVRTAASPDEALLDFAQSSTRPRRTGAGEIERGWSGSGEPRDRSSRSRKSV